MKRLVIVEDEPYMADYLVNYIDWEKIGVTIEAVEDNGKDGLAVIEELCPDIVITDIKMPQMDGITMIKNIIKNGLDIKFVILSSHSEFHMVKEAFRLGISDYILKAELDEESITKVVSGIVNALSLKDKTQSSARSLLYKRDKIKAVVFGTEKLSECGIDLRIKEKNLSVAVIKLLDYKTVLKEEWNMESELLKYGLMNVLEELAEAENCCENVQTENAECMLLISDTEEKNSEEKTETIAKNMCKNIEQTFGFTVCCGWCGFENSALELKTLYKNASLAADCTFICGRDRVLNYRDIEVSLRQRKKINVEEVIVSFSSAIEKFDIDKANEIIDKYMSEDAYSYQLSELYDFCDMCCLEINKLQKQLSFKDNMRSEYKKIINIGTMKELKYFVKGELLKISGVMNENVALVPRVKKYIDENYYKKITLESIAEVFGVGYQKLGREFKKKTDMSLKKYITEVRMNEAMNLILNSEYMLYEISEMVGYANYENFSRMFFGYFKKWPKEIERP